jgi:hypothetical protein
MPSDAFMPTSEQRKVPVENPIPLVQEITTAFNFSIGTLAFNYPIETITSITGTQLTEQIRLQKFAEYPQIHTAPNKQIIAI